MEQKNLGLVADIIDRTLAYDAGSNLSSWLLRLRKIRGQATETAFAQCGPLPGSGLFQQGV